MADWADTELVTVSEIKSRVGDLLEITGASSVGAPAESIVAEVIASVKEKLARRLRENFSKIYVNRNPYSAAYPWYQYSQSVLLHYSDLDVMLNKLANPEDLKTAVAYWVIRDCYEYKMTRSRLSPATAEDAKEKIAYWDVQYKDELNNSMKLLAFDFNDDGIIQEYERVRARQSLRLRRV